MQINIFQGDCADVMDECCALVCRAGLEALLQLGRGADVLHTFKNGFDSTSSLFLHNFI